MLIPSGRAENAVEAYQSAAEEDDAQAYSGEGNFYGFQGFNNSLAVAYIMVFDSASRPANGVFPLAGISVRVSKGYSFGFSPDAPVHFRSGLYIAASSTPTSLTIMTGDEFIFGVQGKKI
jgi:hypothetical protein